MYPGFIVTRFIITRRGCEICREWLRVIERVNLKMPLSKRVHVIDGFEWEEMRLKDNALIKKFEKEGLSHGYPFCYLDGMVVEPANSILLKTFLESYLNKDFYPWEV